MIFQEEKHHHARERSLIEKAVIVTLKNLNNKMWRYGEEKKAYHVLILTRNDHDG